jgi:XTP/dITP diphosphohydrolase
MPTIYIATTNPGKLREFREAAASSVSLTLEPVPGLRNIPPAVEDGDTFESNARIKADYYSRFVPGELVLAEDSGLSVDALGGAPGVHSARYAAVVTHGGPGHENSGDQENNRVLLAELERMGAEKPASRYVCVIALARDGRTLQTFTGEAHGEITRDPRGTGGFGYDPLFYFPSLGRTFAELELAEKRLYSHRGAAFRRFLAWYGQNVPI